MSLNFTITQMQRLTELDGDSSLFLESFETSVQRDNQFKSLEKVLARKNKERLVALVEVTREPLMFRIEKAIVRCLIEIEEFTRVQTPTIISSKMLEKMTITREHPLYQQVFWLEDKCLRPMLAPGLYVLMRDMHRVLKGPVRIFECGTCYRKETQGAKHMNEFTMLNLVEYASGAEDCQKDRQDCQDLQNLQDCQNLQNLQNLQLKRLKELANMLMDSVGSLCDDLGCELDYKLEITKSEVYGETLDIVARDVMGNDVEIGSGSYGPHPLDENWGVYENWVGIGIGIERLAMIIGRHNNIKRTGRSITYVDGARLNI